MSRRIETRANHVQIPVMGSSRPRRIFEIVAIVGAAVFLIAQGLDLFDRVNSVVRDILGEWRAGVVLTGGFCAIIAYVNFYHAMETARAKRWAARYLARRNLERILDLKSRLGG